MVVGAGGGLRVFHMGGPVVAGIIGRHLDLVTANRAGPGIGRQVPGQIYDRCSARIGGEVPGGGVGFGDFVVLMISTASPSPATFLAATR